jgi:hypothetical protein
MILSIFVCLKTVRLIFRASELNIYAQKCIDRIMYRGHVKIFSFFEIINESINV